MQCIALQRHIGKHALVPIIKNCLFTDTSLKEEIKTHLSSILNDVSVETISTTEKMVTLHMFEVECIFTLIIEERSNMFFIVQEVISKEV